MDDIKRKPMQDVVAPYANIPTRAPLTPSAPSSDGVSERIAQSSFFKKEYHRAPSRPVTRARKPSRRFIVAILAIPMLFGVGFAVASYFDGAEIVVVPITKSATLDHEFTAVKDTTTDAFIFQYMSVVDERSKEVPVSEERKIQSKASGKIIIYNNYSSAPQKLIINTRFESTDHKIFRLEKSVTVPGTKVVAGKVEPGSVEAVVYADTPGDEYNIGLSDFTIPGLKGDPRYAKFSARSVASAPIAGGFSGTIKVPSDKDVAAMQGELREELKTAMIEKARGELPQGVSFFPGSVILTFEDMPRDLTSTEAASVVTVKATVSVFFFDTEYLTQEIITAILPDYRGGPLMLSNMASLSFSFIEPVDGVVLADLSRIKFKLAGEPVFIGKVDERKLATVLAGKEKSEFTKVIALEDTVQKANAAIRPFWRTVFPTDPLRISVKIVSE